MKETKPIVPQKKEITKPIVPQKKDKVVRARVDANLFNQFKKQCSELGVETSVGLRMAIKGWSK